MVMYRCRFMQNFLQLNLFCENMKYTYLYLADPHMVVSCTAAMVDIVALNNFKQRGCI
jgi:hypothetical protein